MATLDLLGSVFTWIVDSIAGGGGPKSFLGGENVLCVYYLCNGGGHLKPVINRS
jgi:hypothetical protein